MVLRVLRTEPSAILLGAQVTGVLLYPLLGDDDAGRAIFAVFGILVLGLVLLAVRSTPALTWVAVVLGVPATILLAIQAVTRSDDLLPWSSALEAVLYFYAASSLVRYMLADHRITRDELFAVGATFTLVAWAFAYVYVVYQALAPGAFAAGAGTPPERTWQELLYLSFTNLSGTGLSDIVPARPFARGLVMLEQLAGLGYIAIVVSRMVGLTIRGPRS